MLNNKEYINMTVNHIIEFKRHLEKDLNNGSNIEEINLKIVCYIDLISSIFLNDEKFDEVLNLMIKYHSKNDIGDIIYIIKGALKNV
jgi:hypothetical protein